MAGWGVAGRGGCPGLPARTGGRTDGQRRSRGGWGAARGRARARAAPTPPPQPTCTRGAGPSSPIPRLGKACMRSLTLREHAEARGRAGLRAGRGGWRSAVPAARAPGGSRLEPAAAAVGSPRSARPPAPAPCRQFPPRLGQCPAAGGPGWGERSWRGCAARLSPSKEVCTPPWHGDRSCLGGAAAA